MPKSIELTPAREKLLRETAMTEIAPGPIVHDFEALLRLVGTDGVEAGGQHRLLPLACLADLNARTARPVELKLRRPQLRSYPNLEGLYLLGRATGLLAVRDGGAKARIAVNPTALTAWVPLNPTERYFTLLEALALHARRDMVGGHGGGWLSADGMLTQAIEVWERIPAKGRRYPPPTSPGDSCPVDYDRYVAALLDLFGVIELEQGPPGKAKGGGWWVAAARRTPFGDALMALLKTKVLGLVLARDDYLGDFLGGGGEEAEDEQDDDDDDDADGEDDDAESAGTPVGASPLGGAVRLDRLQPIVKPYFPDYQQVYELPGRPFVPGTYVFKVSLGKAVWWRIAVGAESVLDELSDAILRAARFDCDHLYSFTFTDAIGRKAEVMSPDADDYGFGFTTEVRVGDVPLGPGDSMVYLFDFGDSWKFDVKLERIDPPGGPAPGHKPPKSPKVLEKHGKPPKQYPDGDWD